jgi:hypothetical protein
MSLQVPFGRSDVEPIILRHETEDRLAALNERREKLALEGPHPSGRDVGEDARLDDVCSGVDQSAARGDLGRGLLEERFHSPVSVDRDQPVGARVVHRSES